MSNVSDAGFLEKIKLHRPLKKEKDIAKIRMQHE